MTECLSPLDLLCPMHALIAPNGRIAHMGPTLRKLWPKRPDLQRGFREYFEITRPEDVVDFASLHRVIGEKMRLTCRNAQRTVLKGVVVARADGQPGLVLNLSFGISILDAVQDFALSGADFAPTDLTTEMLYLVEAKSAVMAASRTLNARLQSAKITAEHQALTDALTGLENRRGLEQFLSRQIMRKSPFALMHADLDFFKRVNDCLGHDAGDFILQEVARLMKEETRNRDLVARIGGDEFVLVISGGPSSKAVLRIGARLIERISEPRLFDGQPCQVACSIGSVFSQDYDHPDIRVMLKDADRALYASKRAGRGQHTMLVSAPEERVL